MTFFTNTILPILAATIWISISEFISTQRIVAQILLGCALPRTWG
ncbi:MAG: hypothetical protein R2854_08445 [Caldilineaceae bacterium]